MAFQILHYSDHFSKQQIDFARSLGIAEQDMHKALLRLEREKTPEEVKEEILLDMEGKRCPHCQKVWPVDQKTRYRNRHRNACEKIHAKKNQAQFLKQPQPMSSSKSSTPSSSSASPTSSSRNSTASRQTSISSQSRPAKRKLDDTNGWSSGSDCADEGTCATTTEEQSTAHPTGKRPKPADKNTNEPIVGKASFKQQSGTIEIDRAHKFVTWQPEHRLTNTQPVVLQMADLRNFQRNTAAGSTPNPRRGLVLKIITQAVGHLDSVAHVFRFPCTDEGRGDANAFSDVLCPLAKAARCRELGSRTSAGQGTISSSQEVDVVANAESMTSQAVGVADSIEANEGVEVEEDEDSSDVEWEPVLL